MHFKVLTLFPETIAPYVNSSILGRAQAAGKISVEFFNIRDYSLDKRRRVDDTPFGGGMGRMREVCGAVSGMLMVAGLLYGYDDPGENDVNKKAHYRLVQTLAGQFREEIGSIICREILSNPPSDPNPTPRTAEFYKTRPCVRMVMTAAGILDDYIAEHPVGTPTKPDMEQL